MTDPILITACARSGSSATAGIIDLCGGFGGETSPPNVNNQKGMFENANIRNSIVKPYLSRMGADPLGQNPLPDVRNLLAYPELRNQVKECMLKEGYDSGPWYYKGAKLCLVWPLWNEAFPKAKWVIVRRDDLGIAESCLRTSFMRSYTTVEGWQGWINQHKLRFAEMHEAGLDIMEIWPSKFIQGDFTGVKAMIEWLGLKWNEDAVLDFIEPTLWKG